MSCFDIYRNKTVLVTGHTGFKGSWLVVWLKELGARVVGVSLAPPSNPSHFEVCEIADGIEDIRLDVRDLNGLTKVVRANHPDFIFHLAAQPIVRSAFIDPIENWTTNLNGTLNLLEALRQLNKECIAVFITSDKCYDNVEWVWGYKETDKLGGEDPYSASKGAAELAIHSYAQSYFTHQNSKVKVASARAGNVIGGGDWAVDRIIPDCIRAWSENKELHLRNPFATRPWQHVLEPISGYLLLALKLLNNGQFHGEPFNFGPLATQNYNVLEVAREMAKNWKNARFSHIERQDEGPHEASALKLNCDKALHFLSWRPVLDFETTIRMTVDWYRTYYDGDADMGEMTSLQITEFTELAKKQGLKWAS